MVEDNFEQPFVHVMCPTTRRLGASRPSYNRNVTLSPCGWDLYNHPLATSPGLTLGGA